jgi:hypothetical protein
MIIQNQNIKIFNRSPKPNSGKYKYLILFITFLNVACKKDTTPEIKTEVIISNWKAGDVFYDNAQWTECVVGNMPLIISIPHGGQLQPASIPDRSCDDITAVTDLYTIELAREISKSMQEMYNIKPYLVICNLKRTKIDQNRELAEATCGNTALEATWQLFHNYIDTAIADVVSKFGSALYIDLHGHGHTTQRLELGYSLDKDELRNIYLFSTLDPSWRKSSLNNLKVIKNGQDFRNFMIGDLAFGTMMENEGYRSVPSKLDPYPKTNESYFNGGYNTRLYTSERYPKVFGWQIESNLDGVRDKAGRPLFANAFSKVIMQYLKNSIQYEP